jgi:pimeloyl-ACP methyl ester carboxylesterase
MTRARFSLPAKQYLTINDQRLAYIAAGDPSAPPLLMIHGWLSHAGVWRQTFDAFRETHYCVAVDLLGLADSAKPADGDYSIPAQANRILAFADALRLGRFTLIGHSMGGQIALYTAAVLAPERLVRLMDVAGVSTGTLEAYPRRVTLPRMQMAENRVWLWNFSRWLAGFYPVARFEYNPWFYHFGAVPYAEWAIDRQYAMQPGMHHSATRCGEAILACDLSNSLGKISAPTLVIFGDKDRVVPVSEGQTVRRLVPGSRMIQIENCGHFPMLEAQERYLDLLREFLT